MLRGRSLPVPDSSRFGTSGRRRLRASALFLGHGPFSFDLYLQTMLDVVHRRTALSIGQRQGMDFGTRYRRVAQLAAAAAGVKPSREIKGRPMFHAKNLSRVTALLFLFSLGNSFAAETPLRFVTWKSETAQMWDQPIADFEKQNPGVKDIREIGPQSSTQLHDLITQKLKNRDMEMDVFVMDVIWPAEFASAGWALSLDRFFALAEQKQF